MGVLEAILDVFSGVGQWIAEAVVLVIPMFWDAESSTLTFLGVLAIAGLSFAVIFLIIGLIQNFLHFRS